MEKRTKNNKEKITGKQGKIRDSEVGYKKPPKEYQWKPGQTGNANGAPKTAKYVRDLVQKIAEEQAIGGGAKSINMTTLESVLRDWMKSGDFNKQARAIAYGYGNVPEEVINVSDLDVFIRENADLFTDGQIQRMINGEDKLGIIAELLQELKERKNKTK